MSSSEILQQDNCNFHGTALLASLVKFLGPIISATPQPISETDQLCRSVEGQELLKTLSSFVTLLLNSRTSRVPEPHQEVRPDPDSNEREIQMHGSDMTSHDSSMPDELEFRLLYDMPDAYPYTLPGQIFDAVNYHVFNEMPIRLIAFDSNGANCHLIERGSMVSVILSRIQGAYPAGQGLTRSHLRDPKVLVKQFSRYAILSHTWIRKTPGDVLYHNWATRLLPENSRGNSKVEKFCEVAAREHGVLFGWMDTTCINKDSSTELDESISSMYKWYKSAYVCIAYLADTEDFEHIPSDSWFTRGWTLQELLANQHIIFYNRRWGPLAPGALHTTLPLDDPRFRADPRLAGRLTSMPLGIQYQVFRATSITQTELVQFYTCSPQSGFMTASVAEETHELTQFFTGYVPICRIMELAAHRNVTRGEDKIYSLMGLLGIGISIAYGEGSRNALRRMIQQIMITQTQFLDLFNHGNYYTLLPRDISDYIGHSKTIQNFITPQDPLVLSHLGVHATLLAIPLFKKDIYQQAIPPGSLTEQLSWGNVRARGLYPDYIALDNSTHSADWIANLDITLNARRMSFSDKEAPPFIFLAILSSYVDQEHDLFQVSMGDSLGIPMLPDMFNLSGTAITKKFTDIKPLTSSMGGTMNHFWTFYGPRKISLPYGGPNVSEDSSVFVLTADKAKQFGFKVVSSYFR